MTSISLSDLRETAPATKTSTPGVATATLAGDVKAPAVQNSEASYAGSRDAAAAAGSTRDSSVRAASATGYNAKTGEIDRANMTSAGQVNAITAQDSPLMQRAAQEGLLQAGKRGLGNSSFAAGAATGAMVDRATPLAQQDAATYYQNMRANLDAENRTSEVSTGRETDISSLNTQLGTNVDLSNSAESNKMTALNAEMENNVSLANAKAANDIAQLNAQMETAVSQQNAQEANRIAMQIADLQTQVEARNSELQTQTSQMNADLETKTSMQDASAENQLADTVLRGNQALNTQFLSGSQQMDLAALEGRFKQLIATNEIAGSLYRTQMEAIATIMSSERKPATVAGFITTMTQQLEGGLEMIDAINTINFSATGGSAADAFAPGGAAPAPDPVVSPTYPEGFDPSTYDFSTLDFTRVPLSSGGLV